MGRGWLAALSEHGKAQVAILWSDNQEAGLDYLVQQLRRDHAISLTPRALEVLLERMGLLEAEAPDEKGQDAQGNKTTPTAVSEQ